MTMPSPTTRDEGEGIEKLYFDPLMEILGMVPDELNAAERGQIVQLFEAAIQQGKHSRPNKFKESRP